MMLGLAKIISTFFYVGFAPKAPGTFGSLAALPFCWALWQYVPTVWAWVIIIVCVPLFSWAANYYERSLNLHDPGSIVSDEVLGMLLACAPIPAIEKLGLGYTLVAYIVAFCLFRLFDIWKPGPIGWVDKRIGGGFGVMADDIIAGVVVALILSTGFQFMID